MDSQKCNRLENNTTALRTAVSLLDSMVREYLDCEKSKRPTLVKVIDANRKEIKRIIADARFTRWVAERNLKEFSVRIGGSSRNDLLQRLREGVHCSPSVVEMVQSGEIEISPKIFRTEELVVVTTRDLGFSGGATLKDIYNRIKNFGLVAVSDEAAVTLRLQYIDQPMDEYLAVGTRPFGEPDNQTLLTVDHANINSFKYDKPGLWLSRRGASMSENAGLESSEVRFVFARTHH